MYWYTHNVSAVSIQGNQRTVHRYIYFIMEGLFWYLLQFQALQCRLKSCNMYRKGTSIQQAPVFRHLRALRKSPSKFIIITLHVAGILHPAICEYFHHSSNKSGLKVADCTVQSAEYQCFYGTCMKSTCNNYFYYMTY